MLSRKSRYSSFVIGGFFAAIRPAPGSTIQVTVNGKTTAMRVPDGPLTIPGIVFADSKPVTLLLEQ